MSNEKNRALIKLCKDLFGSNVIGTDFDDVQVSQVTKQNFLQQPAATAYTSHFQ